MTFDFRLMTYDFPRYGMPLSACKKLHKNNPYNHKITFLPLLHHDNFGKMIHLQVDEAGPSTRFIRS
jgi:hypothetical protein